MSEQCENGCPAPLRPAEAIPTFTRRGSWVEVTIYRVPVDTCSVCGKEYLDPDTSRLIDQILEPFHGHGKHVPALPPAKILVEFPDVLRLDKAA